MMSRTAPARMLPTLLALSVTLGLTLATIVSVAQAPTAAARAAAFRARAAAIRSLWFCAPEPTVFAVVALADVDFTAGRVAVAVAPFAPPDALPDGRCAPLRLFRFFAMRQILHQRVLAYPHRMPYRESAGHPCAASCYTNEMMRAPIALHISHITAILS